MLPPTATANLTSLAAGLNSQFHPVTWLTSSSASGRKQTFAAAQFQGESVLGPVLLDWACAFTPRQSLDHAAHEDLMEAQLAGHRELFK